jgi:nitrite reductase (NADH) small subunit
MSTWTTICPYDRLPVERGICALDGAEQVALFRTGDDAVYAVGNRDPFSGAMVLSRGIVGSRGDLPTVASPMHKQVFDLRTGRCLDDESVSIPVYDVRVTAGQVEIRSAAEALQVATA